VTPAAWAQPGAQVLVLRALGLGDLLTALPALRGLRRALPAARIVLATDPTLAPLVQPSGLVDTVLSARGLGRLSWSGPPPALAVNLHGSGPQSHAELAALGPGALWAFACGPYPGPPWESSIREEHEVARWCRLLAAYNVFADPADLDLAPPAGIESPAPGAVVIHPGAGYPSKRWPAERFAAVARGLRQRGERVVVTGSAEEIPLAAHVAELAGLTYEDVLAGKTSVVELAALVADAALVLCGDTGIGHLATAYGTPSVLLFGPSSVAEWGPPPSRSAHTVLRHVLSGGVDPRGDEIDPGLLALTVDDVLAAIPNTR
jgi:ADP-heptose:LPS heptosyltransferase